MNLYQKSTKGNNSFQQTLLLESKASLASYEIVENDHQSHIIPISSVKPILLAVDRVGWPELITLSGNICIIGSDARAIDLLIQEIEQAFANHQQYIINITIEEFARLRLRQRQDSKKSYLVAIDTIIAKNQVDSEVLPYFNTRFILPLEGLGLVCSLNGKVRGNLMTNLVINSLAGGDSFLKYLAASMSLQEFMVIQGSKYQVCQLTAI